MSDMQHPYCGSTPKPTTEDELLDLLATMLDAYDNGLPYYEYPDGGAFIGQAFTLEDETYSRIADIDFKGSVTG